MTTKAQEFSLKLEALIKEYRPKIYLDKGYYEDIDGFQFVVDDVICATKDYDREDFWDFGDGLKSLDNK